MVSAKVLPHLPPMVQLRRRCAIHSTHDGTTVTALKQVVGAAIIHARHARVQHLLYHGALALFCTFSIHDEG